MSKPTIIRDAAGNEISTRHPDGVGWDATYDTAGNILTYRHTNGTGWRATHDGNGKMLICVDFSSEPKP